MAKEVIVTADKIYKKKKTYKSLKWILAILLIILIIIFIILSLVYRGGNFVITVDRDLSLESGIVIYDDKEIKEDKRRLSARDLDYMDNITLNWIPKNIDDERDGSHNGDNYIAYTFYIENKGDEKINYWYSVVIDDVIKKVDDAVRIMIYHNGDRKIYAKKNSYTNKPEKDTIEFFDDKDVIIEKRSDFNPNEVDKFTVVIWLEGNDPDCVDSILGGQLKMHMEIRKERKLNEKE